jgi:hypothetical protein
MFRSRDLTRRSADSNRSGKNSFSGLVLSLVMLFALPQAALGAAPASPPVVLPSLEVVDTTPGELNAGDLLQVSAIIYTSLTATEAANDPFSDMEFSVDLSALYPGIVVADNALFNRGCDGTTLPTTGASTVSFAGMFLTPPGSFPYYTSCGISFEVRLPDDIPPGTYTIASNILRGQNDGDSPGAFELDLGPISFTVEADTVDPSVELATDDATVPNAPFDVNVTFAEPVTGFAIGDITVTNGSVTGLTGGGDAGSFNSIFVATITPVADGALTVSIPAGGADDAAGNSNTVSNLLAVTVAAPVTDPVDVTLEFTADPVAAGDTIGLRVTITNNSLTETLTELSPAAPLDIELHSVLSGLVANAPLPALPCGVSSAVTGTTTLSMTGMELDPGESCMSDYTLTVPVSATPGTYRIFADPWFYFLDATFGTTSSSFGDFIVSGGEGSGAPMIFTKEFTDDPVVPGSTATLEFTIVPAEGTDASALTFTDDLDAALSGLVATGLPASDVCGTGSSLSGTSLLTLTGGNVADGSTCVFSVTLDVPAGASAGSHLNTTSALTGSQDEGGDITAINQAAASDSLEVSNVVPSVVVSGPASDVGGAFEVEFRFSESVTGFEVGDLLLTNGAASAFAGSGTEYTATITPAGVGAVTVTVPAASAIDADSNDNTVSNTFSVTAVTPEPEINLTGKGVSIADGDVVASILDDTDFGAVDVTSGTLTRTFTVQNLGTGPLTLTGGTPVTLSGTDAGDFSVDTQPSSPIAAGASSTFTVTYDPSALATDNATVNIASDDADEAAYDFAILGTGATGPEIVVEGNSVDISDADNSPSAADDTDFASVDQGSSRTRTFTIMNTGGSTLTLGADAVSLSGASGAGFAVSDQPDISVAPAGSTTFDVTFTPVANGPLSATVNISSDDADENPFNFAIAAEGTGGPEVNLTGLSATIVDGDDSPASGDGTLFESSNVGTAVTRTFIIENNGTSDLVLSPAAIERAGDAAGSTTVDVFGSSDFTMLSQPSSPITAGSTSSFMVQFLPSAAGASAATTIAFGTNDPDETRYDFAVAGTGLVPEIEVLGDGTLIADGDTTPDAGDGTEFADAGETTGSDVQSFTINNTGTGTLTLGADAVSVSGTNAADFTVSTQPDTTVAASGSTTFEVTFDPSASGVRTATLSIANDDSDESPFDFAVEGTGLDETAPSGFSVAFDDGVLNSSESGSASFSFTGAEVGATFDFSIESSAGAATVTGSGTITSSGQTESGIDLSGLGDGTLTLSATLTDGASNESAAETDTATLDQTDPTVALSSGAADPVSGTFTVTATFSESVSGFAVGDFDVGNGAASDFAGSGTTYTATITPSSDGAVTVDVAADAATDSAGNGNTAATQFSITSDGSAPSVVLSSGSADPVSGAFTVTATFSESVSGFALGDFDVGNGVASDFAGSGTTYTATITPSSDGTVTVDVAADAATDSAGNGNTAATQFSITSDETAPSVVLSSGSSDPVSGAFSLTATFSESVTGLAVGDFDVGNGAASDFAGSGATYTVTITPAADGEVTVDMAADAAADSAGNGNTAATQFSITNDGTAPSLDITGPSGAQVGAFTATFTFSESVSGFEVGDIVVGNGAASEFAGSGASYTATITPAGDGEVTVDVAADAATDSAGNGNTAATQFSIEADINAPTVTDVTVSDSDLRLGDVGTPFTVAATFSEALDPGTDPTISFVGGDLASTLSFQSGEFSSGDTVYTGTYTVSDSGANIADLDVNIAGGTDPSGNAVVESAVEDLFSVDMRRGSITVVQSVVGTTDGEFDFSGDLGSFMITTVSQTGSEIFTSLAQGDYSVSVAAEDGFTLDSIMCEGGTSDVDLGSGTATVTLAPSDTVICTFESLADPEVDETAIPSLVLTLPAEAPDLSELSLPFDLANTGGSAFYFTAATDVEWLDIDPTSGSIPASGSLTFTLSFNEAVRDLEPGEYVGTITVTEVAGPAQKGRESSANTLNVINIPINITIAPTDGTLTIVSTTAPAQAGDGVFTYASNLTALNGLSLSTTNGMASSAALTVLNGSYTVTQGVTEGWELSDISCVGDTDGGSVFDVANRSVVIDLDPDEAIVCTFANGRDEAYIRQITMSAIRSFMAARADQILSSGPRLSQRLRGDRASGTPNSFAADMTRGRSQASFSASLSALRQSAKRNQPQMPGEEEFNLGNSTGFNSLDVWVQANYSSVEDDRAGLASDSSFGMYYLGADFLASDDLLIGALVQFDQAETTTGDMRSEVEGDGWLAGPYMVARLSENVYFDARAAWGQSDNQVNPIGLYTDDFETSRWLFEANLVGDIRSGNWRVSPEAGIAYFNEEQDSYTDSLGFMIPSQEITLGRFRAGPEFAYRIESGNGGYVEPYVSLMALWDFDDAEVYNSVGALQGLGSFRADARFGLNAELRNGGRITGEVSVGGLGEGDFEANSAMFRVLLPLSMH